MGAVADFFTSLIYGKDGKISPAKIAGLGAAGTALYGALKPDSGIGEFITGKKQQPVGYTGGIPEYGVSRALLPNAFATTEPSTVLGKQGTMQPRVPGSGGRRYFTDMTYTPTGKTMSSAINPVTVPSQVFVPPSSPPVAANNSAAEGLFGTLTPAEAKTIYQKLFDFGLINASGGTNLGDGTNTEGQGVSNLGDDTEGRFAQGGLASLPQSQGYYLGGTTDGMADQIPANINGQQEAALSDGEFVMPADVVSHLGNGNSDAGAKVLYSMMDRVRQARTGTKEQGRKITPNKFTPA